jgi:hypothetical protein
MRTVFSVRERADAHMLASALLVPTDCVRAKALTRSMALTHPAGGPMS